MNWDDLRFLVMIGREGSLSGAARRLKVDQTTVARRLRALEADLGAGLFERLDGRWQPTPVGSQVLARAQGIEEEIASLSHLASAGDALRGVVRITSVSAILGEYLLPRIGALCQSHPELQIEFIDSNDNLSVARREADIALRLARPQRGDFLIRKLADCGFAVFGCVAQAPPADEDWLTYNTDLAATPEMAWLAARLGDGRVRLRCNTLRGLAAAAAQGVGRCLLPCFIGDTNPVLQRRSGAAPVLSRELWMLVHPEARRQARVSAVADWLVERFSADAALFRGGAGEV